MDIKEYGGWLELNRSALAHNLAGVRRLAHPAQVMAVLKTNAYGAGATGMAHMLEDNGVARFAVATVDEAVALRESGIGGRILCLSYLDSRDLDAIRGHDLTPTVMDARGASILSGLSKKTGAPVPVWVKVDTGLGRLGVQVDRATSFIHDLARDESLTLAGVYSTLTESHERDKQQLARLLALRESLPGASDTLWSLASSHGILSLSASSLDVVRPGVMLLGLPPSEPQRMDAIRVTDADLIPVATWKTRVAGVKTISAGEQVGYGERAPLEANTCVATLMVGWADGYSGSPDANSGVLIDGRRCPVMALSANSTLVDVTGADSVRAGDEAVLLGKQNGTEVTVEELARAAGGVYRMLAGIPARVPRIWN
jgi:alanine racemase